jgi:phage tail protein X
MYHYNMKKSMIIHQMSLPQDMIDSICSFLFYTKTQSVIRNIAHYNIVVNDLKRLRRVGSFETREFPCAFIYYYHPIDLDLIKNIIMCNQCGQYISNEFCRCT